MTGISHTTHQFRKHAGRSNSRQASDNLRPNLQMFACPSEGSIRCRDIPYTFLSRSLHIVQTLALWNGAENRMCVHKINLITDYQCTQPVKGIRMCKCLYSTSLYRGNLKPKVHLQNNYNYIVAEGFQSRGEAFRIWLQFAV